MQQIPTARLRQDISIIRPWQAPMARLVTLLLASFLLSAVPLIAEDKLPEVSHDGLHLVPGTEVAAAWVKPDADFGSYDKVMILDAYVAFRKGWMRDKNRSSVHRITHSDVERIKKDVAGLFHETFVEVLSEKEGYPVVEAAGDAVLLLRPAIIDLDVTAPDVDTAARSRTYAASAGAATLYLELYDSVSGEILARAIDRKAANHPGNFMRWTNRMTNRAEARKVLAEWAGLLRDRMDQIHGKGED